MGGRGTANPGWDDIRLVLAIARAGSMVAAGRALGLSRTTILRRLDRLEEKLGTSLFWRTTQGLRPNTVGKALAETASTMEVQATGALAAAAGVDGAMAGPLTVLLPDLAGQALMPLLRDFAKRHPGIVLRLSVGQGSDGFALGEAQIAVALTDAPPLGQAGTPIGPVAFASYAACDQAEAAVAWVGLDPRLGHTPVGRLDAKLAARHARIHSCASLPLQVAAIRAGLGQGLLPCALGDMDRGLVRTGEPLRDPRMELWILSRREAALNARVGALARALRLTLSAHRGLIAGVGRASTA